jgi:hypothetical protein
MKDSRPPKILAEKKVLTSSMLVSGISSFCSLVISLRETVLEVW